VVVTAHVAPGRDKKRAVGVLVFDGTSVAFNGVFVTAQRWWAPGMPPHGPR
jgi:hypothetical protein